MRSRKLVLASKICFVTLTILEAIAIIVLGLIRLIRAQELRLIPHLVILATGACFAVYFAIDGVVAENPYTLIAFILALIYLWTNVLLTYIYPSSPYGRDYVVVSRFIIVMAVTPIQLLLVFLIHRCFGWRRTYTVGWDPRLISMYKTYQGFMTVLRMDLQYSIVLLFIIGFCLIGNNYYQKWEFYVILGGAVANILLAALANHAVRKEDSCMLLTFSILFWMTPIYLVGRGISLGILHPPALHKTLEDNIFILAFILGFFGIIVRILLCVLLWKCYKNFGFGLRDRVFDKDMSERSPLIA